MAMPGKNHPMYKHGEACAGKRTKEWRAWNSMIRRCTYPSMDRYPQYGGRGIRVCDEWIHDYPQFLEDVGRAPSDDHQLDRIDNDGDYESSNVRWATRSENVRNSRKARYLTLGGTKKTIGDWAKELGINRQTIQMRIDSCGWSVEKALTTPVGGYSNR
jgi:hypothetical protein